MQRKTIFLAGANTAENFVSYFNNILDVNKKGYTFVLKGGPGTGKSTLMKEISKYFFSKGFHIEEFYCSSDPKSLDAVRIVEKNICITDGTAPHEQDASLPKVVGEIVDLGLAVDSKVIKHKKQIEKIILKKQKCFKSAYCYLEMAGKLLKNFKKSQNLNFPKIPSSRVFYFDYFDETGIKSLEGKNKFKTVILNNKTIKFFQSLLESQTNVIEIKDTLTGENRAIVFKHLNLLFKINTQVIDKTNKQLIKKLCILAGEEISKARAYHKQIEKIYFNYINFKTLDEITSHLIEKIEKY